jgi:uncharacterized protein (TIGR03546 family)
MLFTRKIGAVLRGKATPLQVLLATTLGGLLGFVPGFFLPGDLAGGFAGEIGLILGLLCLVLVLNANLAVFGLTTLVAKLLSLALLPVSVRIGVFLLEGPLQGLFKRLVQGPITAWFGLEHYATSGGLVLGLVFGVLAGVLLNRTIRALRQKMATVEETSESYKKYSQKGSVKFLGWLFLGKGKGKLTWKELAEQKKVGMPIRLLGVAVVGVLLASIYVFHHWFSEPILTHNTRAGLEFANGATVDLKSASVGLGDGSFKLAGLAVADSKNLNKDLFAADTLEAKIDTGALLRKRFVIDRLQATNARGGVGRGTPGVILPGAPKPPEPPPPPAGTRTIEDYLKEYEVWKQRLEQARGWIEKINGGSDETGQAPPADQQRQQQEAAGTSLARIVAKHLLADAPRLLIRSIDIEGITYSFGERREVLDLVARNVSDAPASVGEPMTFAVRSQSGAMAFGLAGPTPQKPKLGFDFVLKQVPVDAIFGQLKIGGSAPLRGGTLDLAAAGDFHGGGATPLAIDLPLRVAVNGATFAFAGAKETKVDALMLPIGLRGPLTSPAVSLDDKVLQDALLRAGQQELANFVQSQAGKLLGGLPVDVSGLIDPTKSVGENLEAAQKKAEAEAARLLEAEKKRLEEEAKKKAAEELKKRLPGGLQGLIPGGGGGGK